MLLFQATLLQERPSYYSPSPPVYSVSPAPIHRPSRGDPDPDAYWIPLGIAGPATELLLVGRNHDERRDDVFFQGMCYTTGRTLICMYAAVPIPILEFDGDFRGAWPRPEEPLHRLQIVQEGTPELFRVWQRRWHPDRWLEDVAREFSSPAPAPTPVPTLIPTVPPAPSPPPVLTLGSAAEALPRFVVEALIRHQGGNCPITLEPLTNATTAAVTDCYHVFDATALETWRVTGDGKCPVCKALL